MDIIISTAVFRMLPAMFVPPFPPAPIRVCMVCSSLLTVPVACSQMDSWETKWSSTSTQFTAAPLGSRSRNIDIPMDRTVKGLSLLCASAPLLLLPLRAVEVEAVQGSHCSTSLCITPALMISSFALWLLMAIMVRHTYDTAPNISLCALFNSIT